MFESYYKLDANPFRLSADEQFRFAHKNYLKAWSYLKYALEQGEGFIMVTGRPGTGKTTLIRDILAQVDKSKILAVNLVTNQLQAEELLRKVALEFGLHAESYSKAMLLTSIEGFVTKEYKTGKRAVIVIDEAQNLTLNGLEELRLLSNQQTGSHPLFQIVLVGQDELRSLVLQPGMEQIRQRMIASCQIDAMDVAQTQGYVEHRLGIVGWNQDPVFDELIFPLIHYLSGGIPRKINHIVSRLLLYGALEEKHELTEEDVWIVARELFDEERLTIESGDSFTTFKQKYEHGEDSQAECGESSSVEGEIGTPQSDLDAVVGISKTDTDLSRMSQGEAILNTDSVAVDEIAREMEKADERENEAGEIEPLTGFYPYGESLAHTDGSSVAEERSVEEAANKDFNDETVRTNRREAEMEIQFVSGKTHIDESKLGTLTSKVINGRSVGLDEAPTETRENSTEEILNLPSMQAERRKHEIDEKGGFINTAETFEVEELLSGTLTRSWRNIFFLVTAGIFFLLLFVVRPERIDQLWEGTVASLKSIINPAEEGYQVVPPTTDIQLQTPTGEQPSQADEPPVLDSQAQVPTEAPPQVDDPLTSDSWIETSSDEEASLLDGPETIEVPMESVTTQPETVAEEGIAALEEVPGDFDGDSIEAGMYEESRDLVILPGESPILESESGPVERASKDYIATQSKYQRVEIGAADEEASLSIPAIKKFQIYFAFDNTNVPEQFKGMLNDLYIVLSLNKAATMTITGYTDASGDPIYNMNLSLERANAVAGYFTDRGIDPDRILVEGRGPVPKSTIAEHEELEKRFGNRRVEIVLREAGE